MEFDEQHKVIIKTLNKDEARTFIKFLDSEIIRHKGDILGARLLKHIVKKEILDK